jgi:hypothetical protein
MNARDIHVLSLSGLSIQKTVTKAVSVVDDYVQEGGCVVLLEKRGLLWRKWWPILSYPNFPTPFLTNFEKIDTPQEKLLTRFRDVKSMTTYL